MGKEVILTGLRSNSEFHLGNYLGAILPMVKLQKKHAGSHQMNMFIPDLHSFTTPIDYGSLYEQSFKNLEVFVAAGLDIDNPDTFIYRQSFVSAHSELTWILDCFTYVGELGRMTEFKEKSKTDVKEAENPNIRSSDHSAHGDGARFSNSVSVGLFNYPVLMAADILLYDATWIPVGEDQRQHLELTRDVAVRMNNRFGALFTVPHDWKKQLEFVGTDNGVRIRSLRNPEKKMSKSVDDPAGTIMLSDNPDDAAQKIMSATTDSNSAIRYDFENQPGVSNLLQILALLSAKPQKEINSLWEGKDNYGELKSAVAAEVSNFLSDFQNQLKSVDRTSLEQKLERDEALMNRVANQKLHQTQVAVGLRPRNQ